MTIKRLQYLDEIDSKEKRIWESKLFPGKI